MKKLPCMLAMLFSIGLFTACSNSVCENPSDMGETAQEGSSSSDNKLSVEVLPPCKKETEDNCEYGSIMDNRNRFVYRTVKIGNQWWMAENLDVGRANLLRWRGLL